MQSGSFYFGQCPQGHSLPFDLEGTIVSIFYQVSGFLKLLRLVSNCLSLLCSLCVTSIVFWTLMFTNVSEITIASLRDFPP